MEARKVVIRKYENRRLYDTAASRYVNLEEVAQMVRDGVELEVVDAATGEDLTRLVLTQIIVESAKTPDSGFPLDLLRQMVIASGRASQEGMLAYMKTMFDMYQSAYRMLTPALSPLEFVRAMAARWPAPSPPPSSQQPLAPEPGSREAAENSRVTELQRRIEELERLVSGMPASESRVRQPVRRQGGERLPEK